MAKRKTTPTIKRTIDERIEEAKKSENIPNIHFNGFVLSLGSGDVFFLLENNGKPITILNASYTVAKTFAAKLSGLIEMLEKRSGNIIMTTDEIEVFLSKEDQNETKK